MQHPRSASPWPFLQRRWPQRTASSTRPVTSPGQPIAATTRESVTRLRSSLARLNLREPVRHSHFSRAGRLAYGAFHSLAAYRDRRRLGEPPASPPFARTSHVSRPLTRLNLRVTRFPALRMSSASLTRLPDIFKRSRICRWEGSSCSTNSQTRTYANTSPDLERSTAR
jgi:hypothetical protein